MFSVIMPIYNPGKLLYSAIEDILNQSYKNLELICIDDASTDGSDEALLSYAERDGRIRIYKNHMNLGAAYSRNRGIELAQGEYIFFVDADDTFEEKLLEKAMEAIGGQTPDIVYIDYNEFYKENVEDLDSRCRFYFFKDIMDLILSHKECLDIFIHDMQLAPYGRIYNKKFLMKNKLWFQELKSSNDVYFSIMSTLLSEKITHTKEYISLVHVRNHKSEFRISNNRNPFDNFLAYRHLKIEMQKRGIWNIYARIIQEKFLSNVLYEISICNKDLGEVYYNFLKIKGFDEMMLCESAYNDQLSPEYKDLMLFLKQEKFEVGKYYRIKDFYYLIKGNKDKLLALFLWIEKNKKKYAIWGAGENGKLILEFCRKSHLSCEGVIDNDNNKQGKMLYNYKVYSPKEILENISYVIITNQYYFNKIYDQILQINKEIVMVSLDIYLRYKRNILESSFYVDKK